jgi:hypothetical protein
MNAARAIPAAPRTHTPEPQAITLLELVRTVAEITDDDKEIVATVLHMLGSGRFRLCGNLRGTPIEELA